MATNVQTLSYEYAVLAASANPSRTGNTIADPTQPPTIASGGPSLAAGALGALVAVVDVSIAEDPWRRTTRVAVTTYDNAATYTYTQNAVNASHAAAGATLPVMLAAWAAAINASAIAATASVNDAGTGLIIRQDVGTYQSVNASATGSAVLATTADADSATLEVYARTRNAGTPGSTAESVAAAAWRRYVAPGSTVPLSVALDRGGASLQVAVGPDVSIYPYVYDVQGVSGDGGSVTYPVYAYVAPCILPGSV